MADILSAMPVSADSTEPWTAREIQQQPATLRATHTLLCKQRAKLESFLKPLLATQNLRIVLTGAGTSAFVGECLAAEIARLTDSCVEAIPTTDIVSAPRLYLKPTTPTLLISFGRSGNSPESIAAIDLANAGIEQVHHLIITCNPAELWRAEEVAMRASCCSPRLRTIAALR